jgi:hypothetical protein
MSAHGDASPGRERCPERRVVHHQPAHVLSRERVTDPTLRFFTGRRERPKSTAALVGEFPRGRPGESLE